MWFKTRVGLFTVSIPYEICVAEYRKENPSHYSVYARSTKERTTEYKGVFGKANTTNPTVHLARFRSSASAGQAIAQCMELIERAIREDANMCDLSTAGDADAWVAAWTQIEWGTAAASVSINAP